MKKLGRYFGNSVPVVSIPGRLLPVVAYWMEDIVESRSKCRKWEGRERYYAEEEDFGWEADAGEDAGDEALSSIGPREQRGESRCSTRPVCWRGVR